MSPLFATLLLIGAMSACEVDLATYSADGHAATVAGNLRARDSRNAIRYSPTRTALDNVRVFDGYTIHPPCTVVIDNGVIGTDATGAKHIDGHGGVLLPGLIDSHCHPTTSADLQDLTRYGVTTGFAMACFAPKLCESLQHHAGLVDIKTSTTPASAPGSLHGNITVAATNSSALLLSSPSHAETWITNQTAWNPNYVKLIAESPGLNQETLNAIAQAARTHNKLTVCHAAAYDAYTQAVTARVDHVHHVPLDSPIDQCLLDRMIEQKQISTPTLAIMKAIAQQQGSSFSVANNSASAIHRARVPILAGTDANAGSRFITGVPFGSSLHQELELLVDAGLSPVEALRAATINPAKYFQFLDRGVIEPGKRADLLLIEGDPMKNISATRNIKRVWVAGIEYEVASDA